MQDFFPKTLHPLHIFEEDNVLYAADLEKARIVKLSIVMAEILKLSETRTNQEIQQALGNSYQEEDISEAFERFAELEKAGLLFNRGEDLQSSLVAGELTDANRKLKLLIPFHFMREKSLLDYCTMLNRYQLLTHLAKYAELETLTFSKEREASLKSDGLHNSDEIRIRDIEVDEDDTFSPAWHAMDGYNGILLLSQFLADDLPFYQIPGVPIVHCIDRSQGGQGNMLETLLTLSAFQNENDTLVVKASWMKEWLAELGVLRRNVRVIPDGIDVGEPIGKPLAKRHTAKLFEKPMFVKQPVVGLISGFEPHFGAAWISAFARANPHLAILVYDTTLGQFYQHPPENVVIFSADNEDTRRVLPIFFQALDLVCFPAVPRTPLSIVLEAVAFGTPCVVMSKYGMPAEVADAAVIVKAESDNFGNFRVPMADLSAAINDCLQPSATNTERQNAAKSLTQQFTWEKTAQRIVQLFEEKHQQEMDLLKATRTPFPPIFCRRYEPSIRKTAPCVYRWEANRYDGLETALAEVLSEHHTLAEVKSVFEHFQRDGSTPTREASRAGNGFLLI